MKRANHLSPSKRFKIIQNYLFYYQPRLRFFSQISLKTINIATALAEIISLLNLLHYTYFLICTIHTFLHPIIPLSIILLFLLDSPFHYPFSPFFSCSILYPLLKSLKASYNLLFFHSRSFLLKCFHNIEKNNLFPFKRNSIINF